MYASNFGWEEAFPNASDSIKPLLKEQSENLKNERCKTEALEF